MNIVDDEETATATAASWPVRAARVLEQRPRRAVGSALVILAVVAFLATGPAREELPGPSSTPTATTSTATAMESSLLGGLAYQRTVPTTGTAYDLLFSVTAGPFSPSGASRLTYVFRADIASGQVELLARWAADQWDAGVFADQRGPFMIVASQSGLALVRHSGSTVASGPQLDVVSALFLGPDDDPARLVLASTSTSVVDVTRPDRQRVVASAGGVLLGRLDDERVVLASLSSGDLVVRGVAIDGSMTELGRLTRALGPAALQRFPTPASAFRVLALREVEQGIPGARVVSALDLSTGAITDLQVLGIEGTFAPETGRPGVYVFTQPNEQRIGGRGTASIEAPAGRRPFLDPLRSWSPDGALIAFRSQTATGQFGVTAMTRDGRLLVDLQPAVTTAVRLIGWIERP